MSTISPVDSPQTLSQRAKKLGLPNRNPAYKYWTTEEESLLRQLWFNGASLKHIAQRIPNHSAEACKRHAYVIGLKPRNCQKWTVGQDRMVSEQIAHTIDLLAQRMGRTPSAVRHRVIRILFQQNKKKNRLKIAA